MNIKLVTRVVSSLVVVIGIAMLTSVPVSWLMQDSQSATYMLFVSSAITIATGGIIRYFSRKAQMQFGFREGFGIVTFGWLFASIFGSIPFCLVSNLTWYDAFFETMSGFTTTGASVIGNTLTLADGSRLAFGLLDIPNGLIYWRSLTHWLGGMGIVVLSLAILPTLGISAHQLYNAEVPGPTEDQITPRIATSAKILWTVYVLLSLIQTVLLWSGGMTMFDAVCTTFGTMATGGFSTQPASLGAYNSVYIDMVTTLFMFLAGANFVLHYKFLRGKPLMHFKDEEFKFYFFIVLISSITIAIYLTNTDIVMTSGIVYANASFWEALRFSTFQVVSVITTTGFATANFNMWPAYCGLLLVVLMFIGGCGGSTGGGIKNSRILLLLKYAMSQVERRLFVRSLSNVRLNKQRIDNSILHKTLSFFFIFIGIFILFSLLLCWMGVDDIVTATTASIACLGNIGPGLGKIGPDFTFAWMSAPAKLLLAFEMLLGRLELYTVLVIFLPTFWKR
jgi:trk system potassium uptake protein